MRYFAFIALAAVAMLESSFALVDASARTTVDVWANAWDKTECSPDGCIPEFTRDSSLDEESRWSCNYELEDETCEICFSFAEPQDIVRVMLALVRGDEKILKIEMTFVDSEDETSIKTFASSGVTDGFESLTVNMDETQKLCMKPIYVNDDQWLSILEVGLLVYSTCLLVLFRMVRHCCVLVVH